MSQQFVVLADQKDAYLSRYVRVRIAMVNNDSFSLVRFSNFAKEIVMYHSKLTVLRCSSGTVATWPVLLKKQVCICFVVVFPQQLSLDLDRIRRLILLFCFVLIRIDLWFITCKRTVLINVFWSCTANDPSICRFGRSKRCLFEPMCESSHCHGEQWFVFCGSGFSTTTFVGLGSDPKTHTVVLFCAHTHRSMIHYL